jgi:hypothetical protein
MSFPKIQKLTKTSDNKLQDLVLYTSAKSYWTIERNFKDTYNIEFVYDGFVKTRSDFTPVSSVISQLSYMILEQEGRWLIEWIAKHIDLKEQVSYAKMFVEEVEYEPYIGFKFFKAKYEEKTTKIITCSDIFGEHNVSI